MKLLLLLWLPAAALPGIRYEGTAEERRTLRRAVAELQKSAVVRERENERRALGLELVVSYSTSTGNLEGDFTLEEPSRVRIATRVSTDLHEALAHEIYGHGVQQARLRREAPGALPLARLAEDEGIARAVASLAICEAQRRPGAEAWLLALGTAAYHSESLFLGREAILPTRCEARDIRRALELRLVEAARRRRHLAAWELNLPAWRWRLDHFEAVHGVSSSSLAGLRRHLDDFELTLQARRRDLALGETLASRELEWLGSPDGLADAAALAAAALHPQAARLDRDFAAFTSRLLDCLAGLPPAPAAAAGGELDWARAQELLDAEPAQHLAGSPPTAPDDPPWTRSDGGALVCELPKELQSGR